MFHVYYEYTILIGTARQVMNVETYKFHPRIRSNANPLQILVRLFRQLLNLLPRISFRVEERDGFYKSVIHAVARVLRRQDPLHASFGCGVDQLRLLAHGHKAKRENGGIDVLESIVQERKVVVGAFLDF